MISPDVIVIDRADAVTLAGESDVVYATLRRLEAAFHDARDDAGRTVYAQVRAALSSARFLDGGLKAALS